MRHRTHLEPLIPMVLAAGIADELDVERVELRALEIRGEAGLALTASGTARRGEPSDLGDRARGVRGSLRRAVSG